MAPPDRIRNIAVGLLVRDGRALVELYPSNGLHPPFARAIGGGIEFRETADAAIAREFGEELGATLTEARLLAVTENIFEYADRHGHEIVHVYAVRSPELEALPDDIDTPVADNHTTVRWIPLDDLRAQHPPLYPAGALELLEKLAADGL